MKSVLWIVCALLVSGLAAWAHDEKADESGDHAKACFEKLDTNHDGSLSQDEFSACCKDGQKKCGDDDGESDDQKSVADDDDQDSDSTDDGKSADDGDHDDDQM